MSRKAALAGFLILQAIAIGLWINAALPYLSNPDSSGAQSGCQIWSGGGYSDLSSNFRSGSQVVLVPQFNPAGPFLWATLLIVAGGLAGLASLYSFRKARVWLAVVLAGLGLALGAGGYTFLASQWSGDTSFPEGFLHAYLLYGLAQAFNIQFFIAFALLALSTVSVIAGFSTREKPFGFHVVALNWAVVAGVWLITYLALYVAPSLAGGECLNL